MRRIFYFTFYLICEILKTNCICHTLRGVTMKQIIPLVLRLSALSVNARERNDKALHSLVCQGVQRRNNPFTALRHCERSEVIQKLTKSSKRDLMLFFAYY